MYRVFAQYKNKDGKYLSYCTQYMNFEDAMEIEKILKKYSTYVEIEIVLDK